MCYVPGPSQMEMMDEVARELYNEGMPETVEESKDKVTGSDPDFLNDTSDTDTELLTDDSDSAGSPR
jgi:hypothetical protein